MINVEPKGKNTNRFDKDEADAAQDGKRHDNKNHSGMRSHIKRILTAEETAQEDVKTNDDEEEDDNNV